MRKVDAEKIETGLAAAQAKQAANSVMINKEMLPSLGKFYDGDLYARKLNAIEIKNLSKVNQNNISAVFNKIVGDCIEGVELYDILLNDKIWFIYYLRSLTFDDAPYKVKCQCPVCDTTSVQDFTLDKLIVKHPKKDLPEFIELPNGDKITPRYPTIGDEVQINRLKNDPNVIEAIDDEIMTICAHIKEINGKKMTLWDAYSYFAVNGCRGSGKDFAYFIKAMKDYIFSCDMLFKTECGCGEEIISPIPLVPAFFVPEV